jgi:hypothetical protein
MMSAKREEAAKILDMIPKTAEGYRSDKNPDEFFKWTGYTHATLLKFWREHPNGPALLTACGGFATKFGSLIGITDIGSYFELQKSPSEAKKSHAWVPASSGVDPQVGDILRHTAYHVDVAAGWDGRKLIRVAAGQSYHPRPATNVENEFDALKWVTGTGPYDSTKLQGWLDLDKYFGGAPSVGPTPTFGWLEGWWKVWDGSTYWYYFESGGVVKYTKARPANLSGPPKKANNVGTYT